MALGDFNMPKRAPTDPIFKALTSKGLELPAHTSEVDSNLASDKHYDQIAFFPGETKNAFKQMGVFDFDMAVFRTLWDDPARTEAQFRTYVRYYLSDHRPLWMLILGGGRDGLEGSSQYESARSFKAVERAHRMGRRPHGHLLPPSRSHARSLMYSLAVIVISSSDDLQPLSIRSAENVRHFLSFGFLA